MATARTSHAGRVPFRTWETWYIVYGDLSSDTGRKPLVCLHGGPGVGCETLQVLGNLNVMTGIPVVMYDQVGCGRSTHLPDEPAELFTIEFFLEELENLLHHLNIRTYHLLGQSWGGMLALEHAVRQPVGLQKLLIEGAPASAELFVRVHGDCYRSLGAKYYEAIAQHDRDGTATEFYEEATRLFINTFLCRLKPLPQVVPDGLKTLAESRNVNDALWGTTKELEPTGSLKTWSIISRLPLLTNEILVLTGDHDYCGGEALAPYLNSGLNAQLITLPNAGHLAHVDAEEVYLMHVALFLADGVAGA